MKKGRKRRQKLKKMKGILMFNTNLMTDSETDRRSMLRQLRRNKEICGLGLGQKAEVEIKRKDGRTRVEDRIKDKKVLL